MQSFPALHELVLSATEAGRNDREVTGPPIDRGAAGQAAAPGNGTTDLPGGHLWLQEYVLGAPLRFSVASSGLIRFGDTERSFEAVPLPYRFATRYVRECLDLDALLAAAEDPASVTFFGIATRQAAVEYDWDRLPPFLGTDVWSGDRGTYLPPDAVERAWDTLGLVPLNAFEKEVPARHFDPATYAVPASNWYDGPAAGVVIRNKTGDRALLANPACPLETPAPLDGPARDVVERVLTDERIEGAVGAAATSDGSTPPFEDVYERVLEEVVRREYARLYSDGSLVVDRKDFRSAAAELVQRYLGGET